MAVCGLNAKFCVRELGSPMYIVGERSMCRSRAFTRKGESLGTNSDLRGTMAWRLLFSHRASSVPLQKGETVVSYGEDCAVRQGKQTLELPLLIYWVDYTDA